MKLCVVCGARLTARRTTTCRQDCRIAFETGVSLKEVQKVLTDVDVTPTYRLISYCGKMKPNITHD